MSDDMYASPEDVIDYWRDKYHELKQQLADLQAQVEMVEANCQLFCDKIDTLNERNEQLEAALNRINEIAFEMPAPNSYTPRIVQFCKAALAADKGGENNG